MFTVELNGATRSFGKVEVVPELDLDPATGLCETAA
jgi:hypothetical protein